jgi:hypothetical protein
MRDGMSIIAALLLGLTVSNSASAHIASNGFLVLSVKGPEISGSMELSLRDAELAVGVDQNLDGKITWGELKAAEDSLNRYLGAHLSLSAQNRRCDLSFGEVQVNDRVDGNYAWLPLKARCPAVVTELSIGYSVLNTIDPSHRGLLNLNAAGIVQSGVLGGEAPQAAFTFLSPSRVRAFAEYLRAGIWHILSGFDHLLFLISLLLPAVLLRQHGQWQPVVQMRPALISVFKVVTAFTVAHSLTLSLAAFDIIRLPSRLTESVIAASIIVAALNNIFPFVTESRARIAFAFGLLHGFGFASVLADMGLPKGARLLSLVSFNLGIEVGQLAVVCAVMPVIYGLRSGAFYRRAVMPWGSAAIAALALVWLVQRAFLPAG